MDKLTAGKEKRTVMELMTSWERKGRKQGRQEGRREGELLVIKRLLKLRLGRLDSVSRTELARLSQVRLRALSEALLGFHTVADFKRWLAHK